MKKIALTIAAMALVFASVSCSKKQAAKTDEMPADLAMFQTEEDDGPTWEATGEKLTGDSCNTLAADTGVAVSIVVDKDLSKDGIEVKGADVEVVEYLGEKCLKVTANYNPEIRVSFAFEKPITLEAFSKIKFDVAAGSDDGNGGFGVYNCGIMYADGRPEGGEYPLAFFGTDCSSSEWLGGEWDLVTEGQWGSSVDKTRPVQAIQFWSGIKGPLFIKGLSLVK